MASCEAGAPVGRLGRCSVVGQRHQPDLGSTALAALSELAPKLMACHNRLFQAPYVLAAVALLSGCDKSDSSREASEVSAAAPTKAEQAASEASASATQPASPLLEGVEDLAVGEQMDCARRKDDSVWCWQDGRGARRSIMVEANKVAVVKGHVCAIQTKGQIACSRPYEGQITDVPLYRDGVTIVGGPEGYCVDTEDGVLRCGVEDVEQQKVKPPSGLPGLKHAKGFSVGEKFGCAVVDSDVWCWNNEKGPGLPKTMAPVAGARGMAVGRERACAFTEAGELWCYDLTSEDNPFKAKPTQVAGWSGIKRLSMAYGSEQRDRLCALRSDGTVACGQLRGSGASATFSPPVPIEGVAHVVQLATGATTHGCARTKAGTVLCWPADQQKALAVRQAPAAATIPASVK